MTYQVPNGNCNFLSCTERFFNEVDSNDTNPMWERALAETMQTRTFYQNQIAMDFAAEAVPTQALLAKYFSLLCARKTIYRDKS